MSISEYASKIGSIKSKLKSDAARRNGMLGGRPRIEMSGVKFNGIEVLRADNTSKSKTTKWICRCHCGAEFSARGSNIRSHKVKSCGCIMPNITHGHSKRGKLTPEYKSWAKMISRCTNPKNNRYGRYGGRGIKVCARWIGSFSKFIADMGPKPSPSHSIDRINNNGDYTPSNCRWATAKEQAANKSNSRLLTIDGETKTLAEFSRKFNLLPDTISARLARGESVRAALTTPVKQKK